MNKFSFLTLVLISTWAQAHDPMTTDHCKNPKNQIHELRFLKDFADNLKLNKKTATTRRGIRCVQAGQTLLALTPDGKKLGSFVVTKAHIIQFGEIGPGLAAAENTTVEGLQRGLVSIYGPEIKKQKLTAIYFVWSQ